MLATNVDLMLRASSRAGEHHPRQRLMAALDASESTVRRDLDALSSQRKIVRVHGGACAPKRRLVVQDSPVAQKRTQNLSAKERIAAYAATLIGPDDFVYVDAGSSTMLLGGHLVETRARRSLPALPHAQALLAKGEETCLLGGMGRRLPRPSWGRTPSAGPGTHALHRGILGHKRHLARGGLHHAGDFGEQVKEASLRQAQSVRAGRLKQVRRGLARDVCAV